MSNMLRIAGRGLDGTAKAIKTDNEGKLIVSVEEATTTSLTVKDILTQEFKPATAITDGNGNAVLRVVDAAPVAYDDEQDYFKVFADLVPRNEKIKEHIITTQSGWLYICEEALGSANDMIPLDISKYKYKTIIIENNSGQTVSGVSVFLTSGTEVGATSSSRVSIFEEAQTIETGTTKIYTTNEYPIMKEAFLGMYILLNSPSNKTGEIKVSFLGGRY